MSRSAGGQLDCFADLGWGCSHILGLCGYWLIKTDFEWINCCAWALFHMFLILWRAIQLCFRGSSRSAKRKGRGVPWWLSGLRICPCHYCGSGYSCGSGSVPSPGSSACCRWCPAFLCSQSHCSPHFLLVLPNSDQTSRPHASLSCSLKHSQLTLRSPFSELWPRSLPKLQPRNLISPSVSSHILNVPGFSKPRIRI